MTRGALLPMNVAALVLLAAGVTSADSFPAKTLVQARAIRDRALQDDTAYEMLRSLTTEVGPRAAGTAGDGRAVAWALAKLEALGFANVHAESCTVPHWIRGEARAEILAPWPQTLVAVALGGSIATPPAGIEAEVVPVTTVEELKTLAPGALEGRIAFFNHRMLRTRDVSGYAEGVKIRGDGPAEAAKLGAAAVVIRSVGTSKDRLAHTGGTHFKTEDRRIPALAISNPDADLLEREFASGRAVRMRLANTSQWADSTRSANVIGEIPGGSRRSEIVLLGAHLDSWDLGTGAHDDGAGVAIVTAAALRAGAARPARTIRVVLFANEEFGSSGSRNYVIRHAAELPRHVMGMESDLGAFHPWGLSSCVPLERLPLARAIHEVVEPLGIEFLGNQATGETDVGRLRDEGVPVMDVATDASEYFDYHHTANDTFDKIDPAQLRQNVAVYATVAYLAAQASTDFGRAPRKPKP